MPGKKGRGNNTVNGKDTTNVGPTGAPAALPASQAKTQTPAPAATATATATATSANRQAMQNQNPAEDFWTKNSHAKALIMSTLVPGTEPYKIAESHELATDIWKELQAKYAPANKFLGSRKDQIAADSLQASRDFIGDWVEGRPLDKYIDMYHRDMARANDQKKPQTATGHTQQNRTAPSAQSASPVDGHGHEDAQAGAKQEEHGLSASVKPSQQPQPSTTAPRDPAALWKPSPVKHDTYLSEYQALAFAGGDVQRKRQIQLAATKVLMQKLPTRDLRFLWAVMYGGDNTPWPGSLSVVIPGVTTGTRRFEEGNG